MQRSTRLLHGEGGGDEDDGLHEGAEGGAEHGVESPAADRRGTAGSLCFTRLLPLLRNGSPRAAPFNVALPVTSYGHALSTNDTQATAAYLEKYRSSYPAEFLQS